MAATGITGFKPSPAFKNAFMRGIINLIQQVLYDGQNPPQIDPESFGDGLTGVAPQHIYTGSVVQQ